MLNTLPNGSASGVLQEAAQASAQDAVSTARQAVDSLAAANQATAYDSIWGNEIPTQLPSPLEEIMLSNDKLFVVLAVVVLIWIGITIFLLRTDRKIDKLERLVEDRITDDESL